MRRVSVPALAIFRPDQPRNAHTFFGEGIAAHIAFADPISTHLRNILAEPPASWTSSAQRRYLVNMMARLFDPAESDRTAARFRRHRYDQPPEAKLAAKPRSLSPRWR